LIQLAKAHQRFTPDNRQVERAEAIDQRQDFIDELLPLVIINLSQYRRAAQMLVVIGVTARAGKRALARKLN
jgi:hypothetical protein